MDAMVQIACYRLRVTPKGKLTRKELATVESEAIRLHQQEHGGNLNTFYARASGCSHSKILLLVYPTFLRIVITSCNMMDIDTEIGDNHWYIHDVPKLHTRSRHEPSSFEKDLLEHMEALNTPVEFLSSIRGTFDYSTVKVHLVTSIPGAHSGSKAQRHGLLRLRRVVNDLELDLTSKQSSGELKLEVCAASLGNLTAKWLNGFYRCALGRQSLEIENDLEMPDLKLFYPTIEDVQNAHMRAQTAASNIGCHIRGWDKAPSSLKGIFHHYRPKDTGWLFHQKFILAYNPCNTSEAPYYVYIGSANLSQSAWGALERDKRGNEATHDTKLVKISNFECGVVVPGHLIRDLLEPGTESWQNGLVPHLQTTEQYHPRNDIPWNDPTWGKG